METPLHPALVHLPIGVALALPAVALLTAWAVWSERWPRSAWAIVVLLECILLGGAALSLRTGEADEERVEGRVPEALVERHEAAAKQFSAAGVATLALSVAPFFITRAAGRRAALAAAAAATLVLAGLALRAGKAGGEVAYTAMKECRPVPGLIDRAPEQGEPVD